MNGRVIAAVAAALLAILGLGASALYVSGANARAFDGATLSKVFVVQKDIPADADAAGIADSVAVVEIPQKSVAVGAITDLAEIEGLRTTVPLVTGEQLLKTRFDAAGSAGSTSGAGVPKGMQEVSLLLEPANAGGSTVKAGTRVGVIVTTVPDSESKQALSKMFLQNILVTGVSDGSEAAAGGIVTLAVTGPQATQIAAAAQAGVIRLTAQNPDTDKNAGGSVAAGELVK